ncbi:MAG TPA: AraC family transcriptional regulator [Candidatus Copromonas faecavium]|uniref:AraC family transcriptional regulator n=1 Tax=Candidatus Copromonas faecavium (nom. illeg.) TaxID=2840740 RepID=A0A9D1D6K3_9FIRM|nr:AraC family transcriptional regulator [Candidatus Copromonas faecavium]
MKKNYSYKFDVFQNDKNIDITLFQYGWEQCAPMHSYGPAKRNHYLFHYIFSGKGYLSSNDSSGDTKLYKLESGQGFLICPGQVNTYYADEHNPWEYAWVEFDGVKALEFMEMAGLGYDHPVYRIKKREYFDFIRDEIMYIVDNPLHSPINQIGHLYLFFDGLIRGSAVQKPVQPQKMKNSYIKEAISFIELNYSSPITVEDIANYCDLNRNYLGRIFKESMNQTLQHFLMYYRMNRASELLKYSDLTINEIGKCCGYPNQLHFSRAFKNIFGIAPNYWREQNRQAAPAPASGETETTAGTNA